jgi:hypothetical protein
MLDGQQVWVQGKTLADGSHWLPKDREARVIAYPGIERPIAVALRETPQPVQIQFNRVHPDL